MPMLTILLNSCLKMRRPQTWRVRNVTVAQHWHFGRDGPSTTTWLKTPLHLGGTTSWLKTSLHPVGCYFTDNNHFYDLNRSKILKFQFWFSDGVKRDFKSKNLYDSQIWTVPRCCPREPLSAPPPSGVHTGALIAGRVRCKTILMNNDNKITNDWRMTRFELIE